MNTTSEQAAIEVRLDRELNGIRHRARQHLMRELGRVLKPGSPAMLTFSDRSFPTKAIALWSDLHPVERMALVLEYCRQAGNFSGLATETVRGLPRPKDDRYAGQRIASDPVFAVFGYASGQPA